MADGCGRGRSAISSVLPAFYSWRFQAAEEGDFETLATALQLRHSGGLGIARLRYSRPADGRRDER